MIKNSIHFFQKNNYELVSGTSTHIFPLHIHSSDCYGIITEGAVEFFCEKRKILRAGDPYFIPKGVPHYFAAIDGQSYSYLTLVEKEASLLPEQKSASLLDRAEQYITHSPTFNITNLSNYFSVSKYHFIREFKKKFRLTPYQYYINCRIKKVRQGLLAHCSLSDLAYMLGFSHQSHLCNDFKKYMGISPVDYQKSYFSSTEPAKKQLK